MRGLVDRERLLRFMQELGRQSRATARVYFTGGSSAVLIGREGTIDYFHYDFYAQALAKIERSHRRDLLDVAAMADRGRIEVPRLRDFFSAIEPQFFRYPALDLPSFRKAVERFIESWRP